MTRRAAPTLLTALVSLALAGCSAGIDSTYGRVRGPSVNGTGTLAELFRERGHTVRTAVRLTSELSGWADVIVRFAPYPGPPELDEAKWYTDWLNGGRGRRVIYVPRDFDAQSEYWASVVGGLPSDADPRIRSRATRERDQTRTWADHLPPKAKKPATADDWFAVKANPKPPSRCKTLDGPWAEGVDPKQAAVALHQTIAVDAETVLLKGDGEALTVEWTRFNESAVLVVANGSFLLNAALINRARRPLALRVVRWPGDEARRVAFVEGRFLLGGEPMSPSIFTLLNVPPFGWVAAQLGVLGLMACLARAPRLGRPRPDPPSDEDRPVAHAEALGILMARTGQADEARSILETYRRWRHPSRSGAAGHPEAQSQPGILTHE